jgi:hypothetical protein
MAPRAPVRITSRFKNNLVESKCGAVELPVNNDTAGQKFSGGILSAVSEKCSRKGVEILY